MGTLFRIVAHGRDERALRAAVAAAFDEVAAVEAWASDYDPGSEARRVALAAERLAPGTPLGVSSELASHLAFALDVARETDGAFDPTLGTSTRLWRRSARQGELPSAERLAAAREAAGWRHVRVDLERSTVAFLRPGTRLDFGGSAKGEALDRAYARLRAAGIDSVLVDGGGDLRIGAPPPGREGWRVSLEPFDGGRGALSVELADCGVATSGVSAQRVRIAASDYAHVVDPATGLGITALRAATVIARDARTADALATALVVAGPRGLAWIEARPGVEARLLTATPGAPEALEACASSGFPEDGGRGAVPFGARATRIPAEPVR